jgi:hypothetical protein
LCGQRFIALKAAQTMKDINDEGNNEGIKDRMKKLKKVVNIDYCRTNKHSKKIP